MSTRPLLTSSSPTTRTYKMDLCGPPPDHRRGQGGRAGHRLRHGHLRRDHRAGGRHPPPPVPGDGIDFFPLSVDFEEKLYAVGRIPGSFLRREGQPSLPAVLAARVIDRSIRPLFPYDFPQRRGGDLHRHERGLRLLSRAHRHDRRVGLPGLLRDPLGRAPSAAWRWAMWTARSSRTPPRSKSTTPSWTSLWAATDGKGHHD